MTAGIAMTSVPGQDAQGLIQHVDVQMEIAQCAQQQRNAQVICALQKQLEVEVLQEHPLQQHPQETQVQHKQAPQTPVEHHLERAQE